MKLTLYVMGTFEAYGAFIENYKGNNTGLYLKILLHNHNYFCPLFVFHYRKLLLHFCILTLQLQSKKMSEDTTLENLPNEIIFNIIDNLNWNDLINFGLTSIRFNGVVKHLIKKNKFVTLNFKNNDNFNGNIIHFYFDVITNLTLNVCIDVKYLLSDPFTYVFNKVRDFFFQTLKF